MCLSKQNPSVNAGSIKEAVDAGQREVANHEMLRLSLPRNWKAVGIVRGEKTR